MKTNLAVTVVSVLALTTCAQAAQRSASDGAGLNYPTKPIRVIVPQAPGGSNDIMARYIGGQLSERLGRQVVVDNRAGAEGMIGTELVARANPDGYTLLFTSIPHVINPHLYKKVTYDALKDFVPVVQFVSVPLMMASNVSLPVKTVKELIAAARARPGQINFASAGSGSSSHLAMELFKSMSGTAMNHIPYKGTGPLITDLISGQVSVTIASAVPLSPQVKVGKLRGLAVTGPQRSPSFPDLPAIAETVPGYEVVNWFGILAPVGTPGTVVTRVNKELNAALATPALKGRLATQGADAVGGTAAEFGKLIRADYAKWARVVKESGAKVD